MGRHNLKNLTFANLIGILEYLKFSAGVQKQVRVAKFCSWGVLRSSAVYQNGENSISFLENNCKTLTKFVNKRKYEKCKQNKVLQEQNGIVRARSENRCLRII